MTLRSAILASTGGTVVDTDPYYNLTTLHLKGDVNTGLEYNAFSDKSSNKFPLVVNGDARGTPFSPYNTSWSAYFDGNADYLTTPSTNAVLPTGTQNYCLEFFAYVTNISGSYGLLFEGSTVTNGFQIAYFNDGGASQGKLGVAASGIGAVNLATFNTSFNRWVHVVATRSGNDHRLFFDGVLVAYASNAISFGARGTQGIGAQASGSLPITGYLSNIRVCLDSIPSGYQTSSTTLNATIFSVPTQPLTDTSQGATSTSVKLIACHANRFIDRDGAADKFTITRNGDTRISSFSPFLETDTTTGSGYFDGSGDYLSGPINNSFLLGTGDCTIEAWIYTTSVANQMVFDYRNPAFTGQSIAFEIKASNTLTFFSGSYSDSSPLISGGTIPINCWTHIAFSRASGTNNLYINGTRVATNTTSWNQSGTGTSCTIGAVTDGRYVIGYLSDLRILKGTAQYTAATIPVPTAPLTAITNTSLLTLQDRGAFNTIGFVDSSEYQHVITRPSGANVAQGTFSPFSQTGWSYYFDGSGDSLEIPDSAAFDMGSQNYTIEGWMYPTSYPTYTGIVVKYATGASWYIGTSGSNWDVYVYYGASSALVVYTGAAPSLNAWHHFALQRSGANIEFYVDGTRLASVGAQDMRTTAALVRIGCGSANSAGPFFGYISNVRIVKGTAVYTSGANIAVPTTSLTAISGTSLLTCQSNRFRDASTNNFTITRNGDVSVQAFSPFKPVAYDAAVHGASGYFDGSGDYLTVGSNAAFAVGTGQYTLECWIYFNSVTNINEFVYTGTDVASGYLTLYYNGGSLQVVKTGGGGDTTASFTFIAGQWYHVAASRDASNNQRLFVNGALLATTTTSTNNYAQNGFSIVKPASLNGYMTDVRLVKGTAVYTAAFTPPSGPLPLVANTSLLLNFTNAGVIDSTGKNVLETVGNTGVVTTALKKFGTGSLTFDGTSTTWLTIPDAPLTQLGSGDFTLETWFYANTGSLGSGVYVFLVDTRPAAGTTTNSLLLYILSGTLTVQVAGTNLLTYSSFPTGQWVHIALSRASGTLRLFVNGSTTGVSPTSASNSTDISTYVRRIGVTYAQNLGFINGYIDDLRITKFARYVTGTGDNANKMVFNGTNTLALPTKAFPDRGQVGTIASAAPTSVEALVVGGGGGGGYSSGADAGGGGGGAGGFRTETAFSVTADTTYTVTVGGGGAGATSAANGTTGSNSVFSTITSAGGGGGGGSGGTGSNGGSGGGASSYGPNPTAGGNGNTPSVNPSQGNNGGTSDGNRSGGGGGGASAVGGNGSGASSGGAGGNGTASSISGLSTPYAGGGGGGVRDSGGGAGGAGGGGAGSNSGSVAGTNGTTNTGGGAGGSGATSSPLARSNGGNGGSGVVILAYPTSYKPLTASLGLVYTIDTVTRPGYRVYKFVAGTGTVSW